ncbi:MAG: hypothetical protein IPJ97_17860 [Proteobacteria bacterium]|nr:hypothetical protein [Pseudomonadota bacterium]
MRDMSARIAHRGDIESFVSFSDRSGAAGRHRVDSGFRVESHIDARRAIVLDGFITNLPELRRCAGVQAEAGVAELMLAGYERCGDAWFEKLDGSFAMFLADFRTGDALLVRDRFGHRPLYFAIARGTIWAGSEIKALLAAPGVSSALNRAALPAAISYGVTPGPDTLFDGIYKCVPGFIFKANQRGTYGTSVYYRPPAPRIFAGTLEEAREHVSCNLRETVSQYVRECPGVGILLSGGVDSALLAYELAQATGGRAPAISFGAAEWDQEESAEAQVVAQQLGMPFSRTFVRPEDDLAGALRIVIRQLEEPTRFENAVALALTYPRAVGTCTAVLTGEGGDSTLGEYEHRKARRVAQMLRLPRPLRSLIAGLSQRHSGTRRLRALASYCRSESVEDFVQRDVANCPDLVRGSQHPPPLALQESVQQAISGWPPAAQYIYIDLLEFQHCWIERMEKVASIHGIECFHPFQSNALLEFGLALPERLRIRDGHTKPILRGLAREHFGDELAYRAKRQLAAPMTLWLNRSEQLRAQVMRLKDPGSRIRDYLDNGAVDHYLAAYEQHGARSGPVSRTIFRLLGFELWLEMFG